MGSAAVRTTGDDQLEVDDCVGETVRWRLGGLLRMWRRRVAWPSPRRVDALVSRNYSTYSMVGSSGPFRQLAGTTLLFRSVLLLTTNRVTEQGQKSDPFTLILIKPH